MESILILLGEIINDILRINTGPFTARLAEAALRRSQIGAGTAQVHLQFMGQFIKNGFQLVGGGSQEDDVARGPVHIGESASSRFPEVAQFP